MITQSVNSLNAVPIPGGQPASTGDAAAPAELQRVAVTAVVTPVAKQNANQKPIDAGEVEKAAEAINAVLRQFDSRSLQFTVDKDVGVNVVKVVDTQTKELIKQIPSEEMLAIARALDKLQGMLVKDKA